jgi:hypothetical protein
MVPAAFTGVLLVLLLHYPQVRKADGRRME